MRSILGAALLACVSLSACASFDCMTCIAPHPTSELEAQFEESWDPHEVQRFELPFFNFYYTDGADPSGYIWESREALEKNNADFYRYWNETRGAGESADPSTPMTPQD